MEKTLEYLKYISIVALTLSVILIADYYLPSDLSKERIINMEGRRGRKGEPYTIIRTENTTFFAEEGRSWPESQTDSLFVQKTLLFRFVKSYFARDDNHFEPFEPQYYFHKYIFLTMGIAILSLMFFVAPTKELKLQFASLNIFVIIAQLVIYFFFT